jgi:hypothetical protein
LCYWTVNAQEPLSAAEFQAALAVRAGDEEPDEENYVDIDEASAYVPAWRLRTKTEELSA